MKLDEQVVDAIFNELFSNNSMRYRNELSQPVDQNIDVYAKARNALANLSTSERNDVFKFLDVVIADSASVILGILDGTHYPDNINGDFTVTYKNNEIAGDLQDLFIEKAEEKGIYN